MNIRRYLFLTVIVLVYLSACSALTQPAPTATPTPRPTATLNLYIAPDTYVIYTPFPTVDFSPMSTYENDLLLTMVAGIPATIEAQTKGAAIEAAIQSLMQMTGAKANQIKVQSAASKVYPDSCMGLELSGVECLPFQVPGFRVILKYQGVLYIYRTNVDGTEIHLEP